MKTLLAIAFAGYLAAQNAAPPSRIAIRIGFGERQDRETDYSGSISVTQGRVAELIPWRFFGGDRFDGANGWTLVTRRAAFETQPDQPRPLATPGAVQNVVPKSVTAILDAPASTSVNVRTRGGNYSFRLEELKMGKRLVFEDGDVTVQWVPAPMRVSNTEPAQEHDHASLAIATDGTAWTAWQVYENGGDRVLVAHSTANGWSTAEPLTPAGQDIFKTSVAEDSRGRIWVVWSQREGEAWNLVARNYDGRNWSAERRLTNANGPNFFHKLVRDRARNLHLIWIAHMNAESHVMWSKLSGDAWSPAREISGASAPAQAGSNNSWMPDAAADSKGNLYVAWDSYRTGNYDIFMRRIAADGTMGAVEQVTKSPRFEAHASVAVDAADRVWLAWDESGSNWGKDFARDDTWRSTVLYADRRPRIAVFENGKWSAPADPMAALPARYNRYGESPKLACDGAGRMWLSLEVRTSTTLNRNDFWANLGRWDVFVTAYEGDRWRAAAQVPRSSTRPEGGFQMAPSSTGIWAVWTNDNRLFPNAMAQPNLRHHTIEFARADGDSSPATPVLQAFTQAPDTAADVHLNETADVERMRGYRMRNAGAELRIFRGDFHRHTEISNDGAGDGSLEDYFRYMIDAARMDTGIVSDHDAGGQEYTWWRTEKAIDLFHIPGGFTPLFGYERSVQYPNGHRNIVFDHRGVKVLPISPDENNGKINTGPLLYPYLKQNRGICMLHSLATNQGSDYRDNDPEVEPLVEIYQGYHANYEYEGAPRAESPGYQVSAHGVYRPQGFYWNALGKGLKLGTESSSDHISTHTSYTMIYTPSPNRTDLVESMRKRHAYGATDNILLDFKARDRQGRDWMMGDAFDAPSAPVLHVKVAGTGPIQSVEIIKDGKFVYKTEPRANTADFDYMDTSAAPGESWYYVRVIQVDRNMAWSSPIWIKYTSR